MDDLLRKRIERAMDGLPDDKARQLLDYIDFLKSKYADRASQPSTMSRIADGVEDTLRVGKLPFSAIKGTRGVLDTAEKVVKGLADAGRTVVGEIQDQLRQAPPADGEASTEEGEEGEDTPPPATEPPETTPSSGSA